MWQKKSNQQYMVAIGLGGTRKESEKESGKKSPIVSSGCSDSSSGTDSSFRLHSSASNEEPSSEEGVFTDEVTQSRPHATWTRCPSVYKSLTETQKATLSRAMGDLQDSGSQHLDKDYSRGKYYCFAERVCKSYAHIWSADQDKLHLNRKNIARAAVSAVYDLIPLVEKPHSGKMSGCLQSTVTMLTKYCLQDSVIILFVKKQ